MGIIAEDNSDVEILREITLMLLRPRKIGFRRFVGNGCGKLRRNCDGWARNLVQQGCPFIVVVHDLDIHNEQELRAHLTKAVATAKTKASLVLIPKREIEAWLLFDSAAIAAAFQVTDSPPLPGNPESLPDPKRHLRDLVWKRYRKHYLNTVHNQLIAKHIDVSLLRRSASFTPHFGLSQP
jgi:hypothetical protein